MYVWQLIQELTVKRLKLSLEIAENIPSGMVNYVSNVIWRLVSEPHADVLKSGAGSVLIVLYLISKYYKEKKIYDGCLQELL